jgi:hypothetical protein
VKTLTVADVQSAARTYADSTNRVRFVLASEAAVGAGR